MYIMYPDCVHPEHPAQTDFLEAMDDGGGTVIKSVRKSPDTHLFG